MTKAQETYERIEALVAGGMKKADAFRALAEETGKPVKSLQGAYYSFTSRTGSGRGKRQVRETTPEGAVEAATAVLTRSIDAIDDEITAAKERAEEAAREYDALKASADDRTQALQAKIDALEA